MADPGDILSAAIGPTISGGFSLLGGMLSNGYNEDMMTRNQDFQKWMASNSIQMRVNDAQAAGIHPLYALGSSAPQTFPIALDDHMGPALREMGQGVGGAVSRMLDTQAKEKHQMDLALGAAQLRESDARADLYNSEAARMRQQPAASMPGLGTQPEKQAPDGTVRGQFEGMGQDAGVPGTGIIELKPSEQISGKEGNPDVTAGTHPGYEERLFRGMPMLFPQSAGDSPEEIISEMSLPAYLGLIKLNQETYGGNWAEDFFKLRYLGQTPGEKYPTLREQEGMTRSYGSKDRTQRYFDKFGKRLPPWKWEKHYEGR